MTTPSTSENRLVGRWVPTHEGLSPDATCARIERLTRDAFERVASVDGGWTVLYTDPATGQFWELTHPHSEWHGGGPPVLERIDRATARARYRLARPAA